MVLQTMTKESVEKEMAYRIDPDKELAGEIRRIAQEQIQAAAEDLGDRSLQQHERIHEARKRFKKIRSLMRLTRGPLGEVRRVENDRFRNLGRDLSDVRDVQVALETFDDLLERFGGALETRKFKSFRKALDSHRKSVIRKAGLRSKIRTIRAELAPYESGVENWPLTGDDFGLIDEGLRNSYRRGRRRMREAAKQRSTEAVHEWRKRVKDLWYHLRMLENVWPDVLGRHIAVLSDLSDLLGHHHDHDLLRAASLHVQNADPSVRKVLEALMRLREEELLEQGLELGRMIYEAPPEEFVDRIRSLWQIRTGEAAQ